MHTLDSTDLKPRAWTLAELFSTGRYWGFVAAVVLAAMAMRNLYTMLPILVSEAGAGYSIMQFLSAGSILGWTVGAMAAMLLAPRWPRLTLALPLVAFTAGVAAGLLLPLAGGLGVYLFFMGLCGSIFTAAAAVTVAGVLAGRHLSTSDFVLAFMLPVLYMGTFPEFVMAAAVYMEIYMDEPQGVMTGMLVFAVLAVLVLLLTPAFAFDGTARTRHVPLAYRRRSPALVAIIGLLPAVFFGVYLAALLAQWQGAGMGARMLPALRGLAIGVGIGAAVYLVHWAYRIHGEIAGQGASRQLLTPLAAALITLLVPLGYFVLLTVLGAVLRERAGAQPATRALSRRWLAFWTIMAPPVAMAMIQSAVNRLAATRQEAAAVR
ncbi:hypothetical protein BRI6_2572 [plant metagenome]|uniref:Uncharacterized protein n=1 Tax=plant metagenome TaxID=1297885 RepID=A0A484RV06_9ZZZZ